MKTKQRRLPESQTVPKPSSTPPLDRVLILDESLVDPEEDDLPPTPGAWRRWVVRFVMVVLAVAGGAGLMKLGASLWFPSRRAAAPDSVVPVATAPAAVLSAPVGQLPPAAQVIHRQPPPRPAPQHAPAPIAMGRLVVNATPWAELFVDGRSVGNTPVVDLPLRAGTHQLRLVRDGFEPEMRTVVVPRGQTLRVTGIQLRETQP